VSGYQLWDAMFSTVADPTRIRKALFGSVLVRDWNGQATSCANYSPFDPVTGNLSATLLTTDGWNDVGLLSEAGVSLTPKYTTADVLVWQSRQAQRTDPTQDQEEFMIQCSESTPLVDALYYNIPLANLPEIGLEGYTVKKPPYPLVTYRQILAIGVDGNDNSNEYFALLFPRCLMTKPDKQDLTGKTEILTSMTFDSYPDPFSGFAAMRFREGPGWRSAGGLTATPGTPVASVPVLAPTATLGTATSGGTFTAGTYFWTVTSITAAGESKMGNELTFALTANQQQPINWSTVTGATGYKIYRGTATGAENVLVTTISSGSTVTYTDTGSAGTAATLPTANTTLGAPIPSAHSALLVFTPPTSKNSPWTYNVQQTTGSVTTTVPSANVTIAATSSMSTSLAVAGLTASSAYTFTVQAVGSNGAISAYSAASNSVTAN
jgi:hypothetical protein